MSTDFFFKLEAKKKKQPFLKIPMYGWTGPQTEKEAEIERVTLIKLSF